jgi:hypothetical protein
MAAHGAYGFRITTEAAASPLFNIVPDTWPEIELTQTTTTASVHGNRVSETRAEVGFVTGGGAVITRTPRRATLCVPRPLTAEELAHPYLAPIASAHAYWMGWLPFHAGCVAVDGTAWGVIGEREAGKSTLLAALALRGVPVVADDLAVVDRHSVFAGPRTLDLRREAADRFGVGRDLGVVGLRERWRFDLDPVPLETPLGGWVFPTWGDTIEVNRTAPAERLRRLAPGRSVLNPDIDAAALMRLAAFPSFDFRRPKSWNQLDDGLDALLDRLSRASR